MKALRTAGMVVAAVALVATGVGALAGAGVLGAGAMGATGAVAGVSTATITAIGTYGGLAAGVLSAVTAAAAPGLSTQGSATSFQTNPQSGLPYAMGRTRMSGLRMFADTNTRPGYDKFNDLLWFGALLSIGGQIEGIEKFTADNEVVTFDGSGEAIGNFRDFMGQKIHLGGPQASALALSLEGGTAPGWTAQHKLSGVTHAMWALRYNKQGEMYGAGAPEPAWIGKWVKVYDPRLDSTYPGGSGSCRALNEATYVWSDNPGLHALTWALGRWQNGKRTCGIGAPVANIRVAEFVECANVCEANSWKVGGVEWTTDSKWDTLKRILQAGGARPMQTGAMIGCLVSAPRTAIATIESRHLLDSISLAATKSRRDRFNTVIPRYVDEDSDWSVISGTAVTEPAYVAADSGQRTKEIDFPLVQVFSAAPAKQPGQLAAYEIVNSREAGPFTFTTGPEWIGLKTGDVIYLNVPEEGLINQPVLITRRAIDPATGKVSFSAETETYSKHAYALGQSTTPPAPFQLSAPDLKPPAPVETAFSVSGATSGEGFPALLVTGDAELPSADAVVIDYRLSGTEEWTSSAILSAVDPVSHVIAPLESTTAYDVRIGYRVESILGNFTIFANVVTGQGKITVIEGQIADQDAALAQLDADVALADAAIAAAQSTITQMQSDAAATKAALEADISALETTAGQIQADAATVRQQLEADIDGLQATAAQIQQDAASVQATVTQAQSEIASQGASIQQAQSDILAAGGRISSVEQSLGGQGASIISLSQTASNHAGRIASAESTLSTQGASINLNATAISTVQGDVASLSSTVTAHTASISQNATAISTAQGDLAALSSTVSSHGSSITSLQSASSTQAGQIASLTTRVTAGSRNLLVNGGPENGTAGWYSNGTLTTAPSASFGSYLKVSSAASSFFINSPSVPVDVTGVYTGAADSIFEASGGAMSVSLVWLNSAGNEIGRVQAAARGPHSFDNGSVGRALNAASGSAPAGALSVLLQFSFNGVTGLSLAGMRMAKIENRSSWTTYSTEASVQQSFTAISTLDGQYASLSTTVSTQGTTISQQGTAITGINGRTATLETTVSAQGSSITQNAQAISTTNGNLATLNGTVSTQGSSISQLQSASSTASGAIAQLRTDLSATNSNVTSNATAISSTNQNLANLTTRVSTAESSVSQNATAISGVSGRTASLESTVSTQGNSITTLQSATSTAAGDIATIKTQINAGGGNLLVNTDLAAGTVGWSFGANGQAAVGSRNSPDSNWQIVGENNLTIYQGSASNAGYADWTQTVSVKAGNYYDASVLAAANRCQVQLIVQWLDVNGGAIDAPQTPGTAAGGGGMYIDRYALLSFKAKAPPTAVRAVFYLRKLATNAGNDSWAWFCRPQLADTRETSASPISYSPGSARAVIETQATALTSLSGQYASLSSTVSTQGASIGSQATAISTLQGNYSTLSNTVSTQGSSITSAQSAISTLQSQTATLTIRAASGSPNLLVNGGPENGTAGWSSNAALSSDFSSSFGRYLRVSSSANSFFINSASAPADAGGYYTAALDSILHASTGLMKMSLVFLNSNGAEIGRVVGSDRGGHSFDNANQGRAINAATGQAPGGTTGMLIQISFNNVSGLSIAGVRLAKIENSAAWTSYSNEAAVRQSFETLSTLNSQFASLSSTVSTQGVTVSQQQTAITTISNNVTAMMGRWGVELDVNGYISGVALNNNGARADFNIRADRFQMVTPSGGARTLEIRQGTIIGYYPNGQKMYQLGESSVA